MTSTPFSANGGYSFKVPAIHGFINTAESEKVMLVAFWVLEDVFAFDMEKTESNGPGKKRHQGILLELVREDGSIAFALGSNSHSLLGIADGDVKA